MRGGSVSSFNPLAFDRPFLDRKGTPSVYVLLTNGAPFHIPSLEHGIPFNCYECTVSVTHLLMPMNAVRHVGRQQRIDTPVACVAGGIVWVRDERPSNLTRPYYNGSATKSHSTTIQYRQLRMLTLLSVLGQLLNGSQGLLQGLELPFQSPTPSVLE